MTMKFLHTADWQIGMKAQSLGDAAARVREERLAAAARVVAAAKTHGAEFMVVAGDVFEDNGVDRVLVQRVADILGAFEGVVFIIPGNHDPLGPGSVWEHPAWKSSRNVRVMRQAEPQDVEGGILYPCPAREKHSGADPTAWIPSARTGGIRIGVAHGTVEGIRQDEPDYPIPRDAAGRRGLDYLALGHWHSFASYSDSAGAPTMAYSGTHETTKFGERDSGNALIVEIAGAGASPTITPVRTGRLVWKTLAHEARSYEDLCRLRADLDAMSDPEVTLVDLRVWGLLVPEARPEITHLEQILSSRFLWARVDTSGLRPSPEDDAWLDRLPAGIIREAAGRLRAAAGASDQTAAAALRELFAIAEEVAR